MLLLATRCGIGADACCGNHGEGRDEEQRVCSCRIHWLRRRCVFGVMSVLDVAVEPCWHCNRDALCYLAETACGHCGWRCVTLPLYAGFAACYDITRPTLLRGCLPTAALRSMPAYTITLYASYLPAVAYVTYFYAYIHFGWRWVFNLL